MIIKSKTHRYKPGLFRRLVEYLVSDKGRSTTENSWSFFHQMNAFEPDSIVEEFERNYQFLKPRGGDAIALRHLILSFDHSDKDKLTIPIMQDLLEKYMELRNEFGIAFARLHNEDGHPHIHVLLSGNRLNSSRSTRLSKGDFQKAQIDLELYQQEQYPELSNSLVKISDIDFQNKARGLSETEKLMLSRGALVKKTSYRDQIRAILESSRHTIEFYDELQKNGFRLYQRGDRVSGIIAPSGKKYRFTTLGISHETIQELDELYMKEFDLGDDYFDIEK